MEGSAAELFEQSLFQRFQRSEHSVFLLNIQYRMHPDISRFPSMYFYESALENGPNVLSDSYRKKFHDDPAFGAFVFYELSTAESRGEGFSVFNEEECQFIINLIRKFQAKYIDECPLSEIGIITPYKEQRRRISSELSKQFSAEEAEQIEVATIDAFQGREKSIIIISCVRAQVNSDKGVGFLEDIRRMNVMITRAKYGLWIVGHGKTLEQSPPWRELLRYSSHHNVLRQSHQEHVIYSNLSNVIMSPRSQATSSSIAIDQSRDPRLRKARVEEEEDDDALPHRISRSELVVQKETERVPEEMPLPVKQSEEQLSEEDGLEEGEYIEEGQEEKIFQDQVELKRPIPVNVPRVGVNFPRVGRRRAYNPPSGPRASRRVIRTYPVPRLPPQQPYIPHHPMPMLVVRPLPLRPQPMPVPHPRRIVYRHEPQYEYPNPMRR
jgi:hypothetical protein